MTDDARVEARARVVTEAWRAWRRSVGAAEESQIMARAALDWMAEVAAKAEEERDALAAKLRVAEDALTAKGEYFTERFRALEAARESADFTAEERGEGEQVWMARAESAEAQVAELSRDLEVAQTAVKILHDVEAAVKKAAGLDGPADGYVMADWVRRLRERAERAEELEYQTERANTLAAQVRALREAQWTLHGLVEEACNGWLGALPHGENVSTLVAQDRLTAEDLKRKADAALAATGELEDPHRG